MSERDQFSPGVGQGFYGSGDGTGNLIFPPSGFPEAPLNFSASNSTYTDKIVLKWFPSVNTLTYKIYKNLDLFVTLKSSDLTEDTDGFYIYEDTESDAGSLYNYFVTASNFSGESPRSILDSGSKKLQPPTSILTTNSFNNKIEISWSSVIGAKTYEIYKAFSANPEQQQEAIYLGETNETTYTEEFLIPGQTFYYSIKVKTDISECTSENSSFISGQTTSILETPIVIASDQLSIDHVNLTWNVIQFATFYEIYRDGTFLDSTIQTSYNDTTSIPGVLHTYQIIAKSPSAASIYDTDGGTTGVRKLNIVGNGLTATNGLDENKITLNWNKIVGATGYKIYRGNTWIDPLNNMTLIATVGNVFLYDDTNTDLSYNTNYYYSIRATSSIADAISDYSTLEVLGRLKTPIPTTPTGLSASDGTHTDKISLSWNSVSTASFYKIYRDGVFVDTSSTNSYEDTSSSITPATQYTYSVSAVNSFGEESSNSSTNTGYKKLTAPVLTSASDSFFETKIVVVWNSSSGATSYQIYRGTISNTTSMSLIDTVNSSTFTYDDTNTDLTVGTTYYYAVKAVSALSTSDFSNVDSGTLLPATNITVDGIIAPTSLTATTAGSSSVTLNWSYTGDSTSFRVWRNGTPIQTVSTSLRTFTDTTATPGSNISYQISTTNRSGVDLFSNTATGSIKLAKPSINVSGGISTTEINISWASISGATNYTLERSVDNITYSTIATISTPITTYSDTNTDLSYNINYFYRVKATCGITALNSDFSNVKYGYLLPPIPSAFTISASDGTDSSAVNLSWTASENAYSYRILRNSTPIAFSRSNLLIKSQDPAGNLSGSYPPNGYANYGGASKTFTSSTQTLPTGGSGSVTTISFTSGDSNSGIYQNIPAVEENAWYILSVYAKGSGTFRMSYYDGTTSKFSDTTDGTGIRAITTRTISDIDTAKDFALTSNWQRYSFVFKTTIQTDTDANVKRTKNYQSNVAIGNGSNNATPTITLWGVQLEKVLLDTDLVGTFIPTTNFPVIQTTFADTPALDYTNHTYQIVANNIAGNTNSTNTDSGFKKPLQPTWVNKPSQTNNTFIDMVFGNCGNSSTTVTIQRGYDGNTNNDTNDIIWSQIFSGTGSSTISYSDTDVNLNPNVKYYYRAKVTFNGIDSDYSDIDFTNPLDHGEITNLSTPTSPSDYALFGIAFHSDYRNQADGITNESSWTSKGKPEFSIIKTVGGNKIYNPDFSYKSIVPGITPPVNDSPSYNGSRHPTSTTYSPNNLNWTWFSDSIKAMPSGRRAVTLFPWYSDVAQTYHKNTTDHYIGTDSTPRDGISYNGKRYLSVFCDTWYSDASNHFSGFVTKSNISNITFDYIIDNKEWMRYFGLNDGGLNTIAPSLTYGNKDNPVYGGAHTPDSRVITAVLKDPRLQTRQHPISGKTFKEQFMYHFESIWNADIFHGAASPSKPLPKHPSGRDLIMEDLIEFIFTETTAEKALNSTLGVLANSAVATASDSFRIRPDQYWTPYSCGTQAGTTEFNTSAGGCSTVMGSENWRANRYLNFYGTVDNPTTPTIEGLGDSELKTWYDTWLNPTQSGNPRITGYTIHRMATWAWNATVDDWIFNYYARSVFMDSLKSTDNPQLNHVKYTNYEMTATNAEEKQFFQDSNLDHKYRVNIDQYCGEQLYGIGRNVLFPETNKNIQACNSTNTLPWNLISTSFNTWKTQQYLNRSGYIKVPLSDHERYSWAGYPNINYGGPSWNSGSNGLVRYPETPLLDASDNWIGSSTQNGLKWIKEYVFKNLVNDVKEMRHFYRSSPDFYTPWPTLGPTANGVSGKKNVYSEDWGYWFEMFFHVILNCKTEFINVYSSTYDPTSPEGYIPTHYAFDAWRNISLNRVGVPCTNTTCNPSLPIDRLLLTDAFEKCLVSGKKFTDTNTYLWRLSVAPKFFNTSGVAILDRVNPSDTDLPATITINSAGATTPEQLSKSRGVWIKRNIAGIPQYQPRLP